MKTGFIEKEICYDGTQLRSHWISENTRLTDDAVVCFVGAADVPLSNMVDIEDVRNGEAIASEKMLHFIVESFGSSLELAIARQRLLTCIACEKIAGLSGGRIERRGDDIYANGRKLSVSIATSSPVSALIHFAMNITTAGTPLPTSSLEELGIEPASFGESVMGAFAEEIKSMRAARVKVRHVD